MASFSQRVRAEGIQEGIQQGERAVLERLLRRRFGPLSTDLLEKLEQASIVELETWAERVLDAGTLEEVLE